MTWEELQQGVIYNYNFRELTDVTVNIQLNNTYIHFVDQDGLINEYRLKGFPALSPTHIEVTFNYTLRRPNGTIIPLRQNMSTWGYNEYELHLFAGATNLPISFLEFGYKQAINGLTRRLPVFDGNEQQSGHMFFNVIGEQVQPVTFDIINIMPDILGTIDAGTAGTNGETVPPELVSLYNGSFEVRPIDGVAPFLYQLGDNEPQEVAIFTDLTVGTYSVRVIDSAGNYHISQVEIPQIIE